MKTQRQNTYIRILFVALLPLAIFACGQDPADDHHAWATSGHVGYEVVAETESTCLSSCRQVKETCEQNWLGAQEGLALCKAGCMADVDGSAGWRNELETCYAGCNNYYAYARSSGCSNSESKFGRCTVDYRECVAACPE